MSATLFTTFRADKVDRDYWLGRCEGYRVESARRRIGIVESMTFVSRADRPDALVLRTGFLRRKPLVVPITDVVEIIPRELRIVVRDSSTV